MTFPDYEAILEWHQPPPPAAIIEDAYRVLMDPQAVRGGVVGPGRVWNACRRWLAANGGFAG